MINKIELLKKLGDSIKSEESLIGIYSDHLQNAIVYSTIKKAMADEIVENLEKLKNDSVGHKMMINNLIDAISKSEKDVY